MSEREKRHQFVHLRAHSSYSLSKGAIKIGEMVSLCIKHDMPALAITDNSNLFGSLEFAMACSGQGIQPIIGIVINFSLTKKDNDPTGKLILIAKNDIGYKNLLKIVSDSYLLGKDHQNPSIAAEDFENHSEGIIVLSGGFEGLIGQHILNNHTSAAEETVELLKKLFPDHLYIELSRHDLDEEKITEQPFIDLAYKHDLPLVATNDVYFATKDMHEAHDALICIADGTYVSEENRKRYTPDHYFKTSQEMAELFSDIPEAIHNTIAIAKRCSIMPEACDPMLPGFATEGGRSEEDELRAVAEDGLKMRLEQAVFTGDMDDKKKEEIAKPYFERLDYELSVINRMEFPGYFLIVSDFMRWSNENNVPTGPGRGSGAGSVVAWSLEITGLDPLRFGLLFERFLNPERVSMPDFDIDFCQEKRDKVIKYVQDKYGEERVAQIITFGKLQARAVLRDVGRVLQMPYGQVDRICKMIPSNPLDPVTLSQAIEMDPELRKEAKTDESVAKLLDIGLKLEGLHRHASTHAAGVIIASDPIVNSVPLYTDHGSPIPTTQYSMKYAEAAGLVKFDFLGLKTLTVIARTCKLIEEQGEKQDVANDVLMDDKATFDMLSEGASTGVFQMESAGMRDALRKMKPDRIEDIIALISLYRPGPMENIPTYIARKHGKEEAQYPHPMLEDCLKETYGVIIYQEQVLEIAKTLSGYSLGQADILRRAMGKKIISEMNAQREMFVDGAVKNGVDKNEASKIFDLVAKFAGYGFNKSHAAAYAAIGYQTAYLKAHFPVEFFTASMNIDIGDTDKLNVFREAGLRSGIKILPPDINKSAAYFTVEKLPEDQIEDRKRAVRYGLGALKNVGLAAMQEMIEEREKNGDFKDIFDFARRCDPKVMNKRQIESLAKAGAFDCLHDNRHQIFEGASILIRYNQVETEERNQNQNNLFGESGESAPPVDILPNVKKWQEDEIIANEYEAIGFYLLAHPLDIYLEALENAGIILAKDLTSKIVLTNSNNKKDGEYKKRAPGQKGRVAGVVNKITHRATANRRFAYLLITDPTGSMEISVFDEELISDSRELIESNKPLLIKVDARRDEGGVRLQAEDILLLDDYLNNRQSSIVISLGNTEPIEKIKNILDLQNKGKSTICFNIVTPQNINVEITLADRYSLDPRTTKDISDIGGVLKVATS